MESTRHRLVFFVFFTIYPSSSTLYAHSELIQLFHERVSLLMILASLKSPSLPIVLQSENTLREGGSEENGSEAIALFARGIRGDKHRCDGWHTHHWCSVHTEIFLLPTLLICSNTRS